MTVQSTNSSISYVGTGSITTFAYPFKTYDQTWLKVYVNGTLKTLTTHYTVTGVGSDSGGNIVFVSAPANGAIIYIDRSNIPESQLTDYTANDKFPAETHERALDKLTMLIQRLFGSFTKSISIPNYETSNVTLPPKAQRAGQVLRFDNQGNIGVDSYLDTAPVGTFLQSGVGAIERGYLAKVRDVVSVADFGAVGDGVASDTTSFANHINKLFTQNGGTGTVPIGAYVASVSIKGEFQYGVNFDFQNAALIPASGVCVTLGSYANPAGSYRLKTRLQNFYIKGAGSAVSGTVGVKIDETADVFMDHGIIRDHEKGLWLNGGLITDYTNMVIRFCGTGIVANSTSNFAPNSNNFYNVRVIENDLGITYDGNPNGVTNWFACEVEANNLSGTTSDGKKVVNLTNAGHHNFIGCHFENNKGQYGLYYEGAASTKQLTIFGSELIQSAAGTGVHVETGRATIIASRITGATNAIYFGSNASGTVVDTEGNFAGTTTYVIGVRSGRIGFGINPISSDPLIQALPAALVAASNIATKFSNDTILHASHNSAGSRIAYLGYSNSSEQVFHCDIAQGWRFDANNSARMYIGRGGALNIEPGADNTISCGSGSIRWSVIYAGTGTINTSDENYKQDIDEIDPAVLRAWGKVKYCSYRFKDAVEEKGSSARIHFGVIAQQVKAAFESEGLDPFKYGILCYDEWESIQEVRDEDGNLIRSAMSAGSRYGVRYEEALALECAYLRSKL